MRLAMPRNSEWGSACRGRILTITLTMRKNALFLSRFLGLGLMLLIGLAAGRASAQIYAQDDAAGYTNSAGGNFAWEYDSSTNGGFGFQPWVFQQAGPTYHGFYLGKQHHASVRW